MRVAAHRHRRWIISFLIVVASVIAASLVGLGEKSNVVVAADAAPSYELFDFEIQYPYVDPRDEYVDEPVVRSTTAGVSYAGRWAGSSYPGKANCEIILYGATGDVVGRVDFAITSGTPEAPPTNFWPQIEVSAPPVSATGSCANSAYPTGSGYAFERPTISRPTDSDTGRTDTSRTKLSFPSRWATTTDPALRTCSVIVHYKDGGSDAYGPLNVYLPNGEPFVITPPIADPQSIQDAEVRCSELDA